MAEAERVLLAFPAAIAGDAFMVCHQLLELLGDLSTVPESLVAAHRCPLSAEGVMDITRAPGWLNSILATAMRLPPPGQGVPVQLIVTEQRACIGWSRNFGGFTLCSRQEVRDHLLLERIGPATFVFKLHAHGDKVVYVQQCVKFLGIVLPSFAAPHVGAVDTAGPDGSWHVQVDIAFPASRPLCRYQGWMKPK